MRSLVPRLITALKHLIKADEVNRVICLGVSKCPWAKLPFFTIALISLPQGQASEAMEVLDELMESEVSIIVPHLAEIVRFCLEVSSKN